MSALPSLPDVTIANTFGASLIGALVSSMLYGLTTLQTYLYFAYYPADALGTKLLVSGIWVLDTVHTALMSVCIYHYLVSNFGTPDILASPGHWTLFVSIALNVVIACIVQIFFVVRIFRLCGPRSRWIVAVVLYLAVFAHFAFGVETIVYLFIVKFLAKIPELNLVAAAPFAIFSVLSDFLVAGSLCYLLHGSRTGFKSTDTAIKTLIIYAVNRCLLTAGVATLEVIIFKAVPHSLWHLAIDFVVGKLYANSLLATLNGRIALRNVAEGIQDAQISRIDFNGYSSRRSETKDDPEVVVPPRRAELGRGTGDTASASQDPERGQNRGEEIP